MDNPVQTKCSTGKRTPQHTELRSSSTEKFILVVSVLNCYAVPLREAYDLIPRAALHLHGVIHVKVLRT
jgi:hypothetical protein